MSCHDIGRGMNTVAKVVTRLYDEGCYDRDTARRLLAACRKGVHWCDGNEDEAIACIRSCRCGKCLKNVKKGDKLFSVWDVSAEVGNRYNIMDVVEPPLAADRLCDQCFVEVLNNHCKSAEAGVREQNYILSHCVEREYTSEGE